VNEELLTNAARHSSQIGDQRSSAVREPSRREFQVHGNTHPERYSAGSERANSPAAGACTVNLRERARLACLDRIEADELELQELAEQALRRIVGDDLPIESVAIRPYSSPPMAEFTVQGLTFRVAARSVEHTHHGEGSEREFTWEDTEIKILVHRPPTDHPIESLADLGEVLRDDPLHEAKGAAQASAEAAARSRPHESFGLARGPVVGRRNGPVRGER
jgi:hypothetical protein